MKIIITEDQLKYIIESEVAPNLNGGDIHEYPGSEVSPTTNVTTPDGDKEYGKPMNTGTDRVANKITPQGFYPNRVSGSRTV